MRVSTVAGCLCQMTPAHTLYALSSVDDGENALAALRRRFKSEADRLDERRIYYDTFDWRLHRSGSRLVRTRSDVRDELCLCPSGGGATRRLRPAPEPGLIENLPAGPLRGQLSRVIEMRRLLPQVELHHRGEELRLLDDEAKIVCRIRFERRTARRPRGRGRALSAVVRVLPVRGYRKAAKEVDELLIGELGLTPLADGELESALALFGRSPGDYSSKLKIPLAATMRADEAAKAIHSTLLQTLRVNEPGLLEDLDTEFLHDFRVAVRRTRSALSQIKQVFPERRVERFRRGFGWLGRLTGKKRDLDVYQLKLPAYREQLPDDVASHLAPLEHLIEEERRREQKRLFKALGGARYRDLLTGWEAFLKEPAPARTSLANADRPAAEVASERIWKVYRRILKRGRQIAPESPAEELHRLRIEAKKLRYLMEFFRSLYPDEIDKRIRALKRLQDNLGDFNDFVVQQQELATMARQLGKRNAGGTESQLALGRLLDRLHTGEAKERRAFAGRFARFDSRANRDAYRELFAPAAGKPLEETGS